MEAGMKYRFNIVNCEKVNSQFNFGRNAILFGSLYGIMYDMLDPVYADYIKETENQLLLFFGSCAFIVQ